MGRCNSCQSEKKFFRYGTQITLRLCKKYTRLRCLSLAAADKMASCHILRPINLQPLDKTINCTVLQGRLEEKLWHMCRCSRVPFSIRAPFSDLSVQFAEVRIFCELVVSLLVLCYCLWAPKQLLQRTPLVRVMVHIYIRCPRGLPRRKRQPSGFLHFTALYRSHFCTLHLYVVVRFLAHLQPDVECLR